MTRPRRPRRATVTPDGSEVVPAIRDLSVLLRRVDVATLEATASEVPGARDRSPVVRSLVGGRS